jgi:hypothetical protein
MVWDSVNDLRRSLTSWPHFETNRVSFCAIRVDPATPARKLRPWRFRIPRTGVSNQLNRSCKSCHSEIPPF